VGSTLFISGMNEICASPGNFTHRGLYFAQKFRITEKPYFKTILSSIRPNRKTSWHIYETPIFIEKMTKEKNVIQNFSDADAS
jgi:hypothetical protein